MKFPAQVLAAAKRDAATLELERLQQSGQRFLPNPAGIKAWPDALSGVRGPRGVRGVGPWGLPMDGLGQSHSIPIYRGNG